MSTIKLFKRENKFTKKLRSDISFWQGALNERRRYNKQSIELLLELESMVLAAVQMKELKDEESLIDHLPISIPRLFKRMSDQREFEKILKETKYDCTKL